VTRWREASLPEARELAMLAVEEAAANVFEHGYGNQAGCSLEVTVRLGERERFAVILRDRAPVFDVTSLPPVDLDRLACEFATRGAGWPSCARSPIRCSTARGAAAATS